MFRNSSGAVLYMMPAAGAGSSYYDIIITVPDRREQDKVAYLV
jgi:hypothetical protein